MSDSTTEPGETGESGDAEPAVPRSAGKHLAPGQQSAWERWEMPSIESGHVVSRSGRAPVAREEEVEIEPLSVEQIEEIRKAAYAEGFAEGKESGQQQGYDAGFASGTADVSAQAGYLRSIVSRLAQPITSQDAELEKVLTGMVTEIARNVVRAELVIQPGAIQQIVASSLTALASFPGELILYLHPEDLALLEQETQSDASCQVRATDDLARGGCRAERGLSFTDYSLDVRFRQAVAGFVDAAYVRPVAEQSIVPDSDTNTELGSDPENAKTPDVPE